MSKRHLLLFLVVFLCANVNAQPAKTDFTTKFVIHSVTYNGSDNPNECWESVAWGIIIEDGKKSYFFSMPYREMETLKTQIGDSEVSIEVGFYGETSAGSGEHGWVKKITLNGVTIFDYQ